MLDNRNTDSQAPGPPSPTGLGSNEGVFIIDAHFDYHEEYGEGVVDNWSGARLLPSLFEGLKSMKHTFRFIGFAEEEKGLIGSTFDTKQLPLGRTTKYSAND